MSTIADDRLRHIFTCCHPALAAEEHGNWPGNLTPAELASTAYTWALVLTALKGYTETGTPQPIFIPAAPAQES